jgi:glycerol kinase
MERYIGALDQGTTSTRFMIFDRKGRIVASHQVEHQQIFPKPGWVEHDPEEIWSSSEEVIRVAMETGNVDANDLVAIGITNQRETTIVWDQNTGKPYDNAVVWQDTRTDDICKELSSSDGPDRLRGRTGLPFSTYFSGPKLLWLLENQPGLRTAAEHGDAVFGNVDTWLIWKLTGGSHVTDVTNASRTMLMNLQDCNWDDELLETFTVPRQMLPQIRASSDPSFYGSTLPEGPVKGRVPVCGDLGDQQAALYGQTCFRPGEVKNTYGTGCFMLIHTGEKIVGSTHGLLTTVAYKIGDEPTQYALEGSIAVTGALVQWLRDNLGLIESSSDVESLAKSVTDSGGIYIVPAFSGLFAPYWRSDARGTVVGLTRFIDKGHIARAALEATAYQTRDVLEAMREESAVELKTLKADGGMVVNELLMQFQADILGVPVVRPTVSETTALGAAYAAGLAVGYWKDEEELRTHWQADREWQPQMDETTREKLYRGWNKAIEKSLNWVE